MQIRVPGRKQWHLYHTTVMVVTTSEENLEREAPVIEMMHAVGKEAAPDSHPSIVQMSYKCDIVITGQ